LRAKLAAVPVVIVGTDVLAVAELEFVPPAADPVAGGAAGVGTALGAWEAVVPPPAETIRDGADCAAVSLADKMDLKTVDE